MAPPVKKPVEHCSRGQQSSTAYINGKKKNNEQVKLVIAIRFSFFANSRMKYCRIRDEMNLIWLSAERKTLDAFYVGHISLFIEGRDG